MPRAATVRIAPSLLSADFGRLKDDLAMLEAGGADWLHFDVMDGSFVPPITFGTKVLEACRKLSSLPIDVHLMVNHPETQLEDFAKAGASVITIHTEAASHIHRQVARIRELGCKAGVTMNPGTPIDDVQSIIADIDLLLIMSVNPGYGGQKFIPASLEKIARARTMLDAARSSAALEVDGGVSRDTIAACWKAGADTFVAGNAVFSAKDPATEIRALRALCSETA
jgi:ribulose-phosphate 3-epimerase